jgi:hypothetical protein
LDGSVVTILIDKMQAGRQITDALFGIYEIRAESFSYRYVNASTFTGTGNTADVSHTLPWENMRDFDVTQEGATVRFRSRTSDQAEFLLDAQGMRYSVGGKLLRVWRRSKLQ